MNNRNKSHCSSGSQVCSLLCSGAPSRLTGLLLSFGITGTDTEKSLYLKLLIKLQQILLRDFLRGISSTHRFPQLHRLSWASSHILKWQRNTSFQ